MAKKWAKKAGEDKKSETADKKSKFNALRDKMYGKGKGK